MKCTNKTDGGRKRAAEFVNKEISTVKEGKSIKRVYYQTLGCKVNSYETDAIRTLFESRGFITTEKAEECDVYVVNTCTVTAEADRKSRQMLRRAHKLAPHAIVAAMGCLGEIRCIDDLADISVGTKRRSVLVDRVIGRISDRACDIFESGGEYEEFGPIVSREGTRAFIKIQDGCDNFCSYCIIPYVRGRARSRTPEEVVREIRRLGEKGYCEVVFTGINLSSYGKQWGLPSEALKSLLNETSRIDSVRRIRLGSLEPNLINENFVAFLSETEKFCRHLHISLQSGSDSVLFRMNRKYGTAEFTRAVSLLRAAMPGISITTDIIVGFPGETDSEHRESIHYCEKTGFSKIHVFPYSVREGTSAARMKLRVDPSVKNQRTREFLALSDRSSEQSLTEMVGKTVSVLVESSIENKRYSGYSRDYHRVCFAASNTPQPGTEHFVRIDGFDKDILLGEEVISL